MCSINIDNTKESYIQVLQANHGDALILHCNKSDKRGVIIIDGGPSPNPRFNPFVKEVEKCLPIDLMILTHFDDDHLVGIKNFIERHQNDIPFPVKRIWANCAKHVDFDTSENLTSNIAHYMKPEFEDYIQIKYWTSNEVVNRFGGYTTLPQ